MPASSGLGALAPIEHVQGQLGRFESAHRVRQPRPKVNDIARLQDDAASVRLDLERAFERVQDGGHRGRVLAEELARVEAEEDQPDAPIPQSFRSQ